jgi:GT2 family glycosyltransferase
VLIGVYDTIPASEVVTVNGNANWIHRKTRPERGLWVRRRPPDSLSDYLAFIPCLNRSDLLDRAVASVRRLWPSLVVVDQTQDGLQSSDHPWMNHIGGVFRVTNRELSFTQIMNWAQAEACERGADYLVFMHNDAECIGDISMQVLEYARQHPNAGVVFTNYDAYAVFRVSALQDVGPWDETFRWYFSDVDYYLRLRLRGWQTENFGGERVVHHASQTIQFDSTLAKEVGEHSKWNADHYQHKWGGTPGNERHIVPYDGRAW